MWLIWWLLSSGIRRLVFFLCNSYSLLFCFEDGAGRSSVELVNCYHPIRRYVSEDSPVNLTSLMFLTYLWWISCEKFYGVLGYKHIHKWRKLQCKIIYLMWYCMFITLILNFRHIIYYFTIKKWISNHPIIYLFIFTIM